METTTKVVCRCGSEDVSREWLVPFYEDCDEDGNGMGEKVIGGEYVCNACGGTFSHISNEDESEE